MKKYGIVYIATGKRYIQEAVQSVITLRKHITDIHVTLFSSEAPNTDLFDDYILIEKPFYSYMDKIIQLRCSPYEYNIFLDTDTFICANFFELFDLLKTYDVAAAYDMIKHLIPLSDVPTAIPEFNTGVIVFKQSNKWQSFCDSWQQQYQRYIDSEMPLVGEIPIGDQTPFLQTIHHRADLRVVVIPEEYNCPVRFSGCVNGIVKILHGRHEDLPFIAQQINAFTVMRIHYLHYDRKRVVLYQTNDVRSTHYYLLRKRINQYRVRIKKYGLIKVSKRLWISLYHRIKYKFSE